jgi:hypothetical protein
MGPFKLLALVFATTATASTFYSVIPVPANSTSAGVQASVTVSISSTLDVKSAPIPVHTPAVITSFPNTSDSGVMSAVSSTSLILSTTEIVGQCLILAGCVVSVNGTAAVTVFPTGASISIPTDLAPTTTANQSIVIVTETYNPPATLSSATDSATKSVGTTTSIVPVSSGGKVNVGAALGAVALVFGVLGA